MLPSVKADCTTLTYQPLCRELDENRILEFSMLAGHYVMATTMLDVAGCEVEPAFSLDTRTYQPCQ
jgi:hypothetical protein